MTAQNPIRLTEREYQIVRMLARGELQKNIATDLGTSLDSVKNSLNTARRKVGANTTVQLVAMVVRKEALAR